MKHELALRMATVADAELLLQWRNDPQTRNASHTQESVSLSEHQQWLTGVLQDKNKKLYIAEHIHHPVGTVRADLVDGKWLMSWTVAPFARGQGFAISMVNLAVNKLAAPVCAEVKEGNLASIRVAEQVGMRLRYKKGGVLYYEKRAIF